jgi:hypothetical protein
MPLQPRRIGYQGPDWTCCDVRNRAVFQPLRLGASPAEEHQHLAPTENPSDLAATKAKDRERIG